MEALTARISQLDSLPCISEHFVPLLQSLNDSECGKDLVGRLIATDPQLSLIVLQQANSALRATQVPASSVVQAVMRLGFVELKRIVIAHYALIVAEGGRGWGLDRQSSWLGAYAGAVAAAKIASMTGAAAPDVCYTAGLLRDCGKLAMDRLLHPEAITTLLESRAATGSAIELERKAFGFDHAQAGAALAQRWSLPSKLCTAIGNHHGPLVDDGISNIVQCADAVAVSMGLGLGLDGLRYNSHGEALRSVGITRNDFEELCMETLESCGQAFQFLDLGSPE